jgi:hypothetical protein
MIARIIIGSIIIAAGAFIVIKAEWFHQNFGAIPWAEQHLHTEGGSRMMYKLIGILIIVIGMMAALNLMQALLIGIFGKLFGGFA